MNASNHKPGAERNTSAENLKTAETEKHKTRPNYTSGVPSEARVIITSVRDLASIEGKH